MGKPRIRIKERAEINYPLHEMGVKYLSYAVLRRCAKDIAAQKDSEFHEAEWCVQRGGIDLYLGLLGSTMSHEDFINKSLELLDKENES